MTFLIFAQVGGFHIQDSGGYFLRRMNANGSRERHFLRNSSHNATQITTFAFNPVRWGVPTEYRLSLAF